MKTVCSLAACAVLLWTMPAAALVPSAPTAPVDDGRGTAYVVKRSDNICGLDEPRQLTRPARVDYPSLLAATPEMRKMRKDHVDPNSPRGIQLRTDAAARVRRACEKVRTSKKFCSVWKRISRRDGKRVVDLSSLVKQEIQKR